MLNLVRRLVVTVTGLMIVLVALQVDLSYIMRCIGSSYDRPVLGSASKRP